MVCRFAALAMRRLNDGLMGRSRAQKARKNAKRSTKLTCSNKTSNSSSFRRMKRSVAKNLLLLRPWRAVALAVSFFSRREDFSSCR